MCNVQTCYMCIEKLKCSFISYVHIIICMYIALLKYFNVHLHIQMCVLIIYTFYTCKKL